MHWTLASFRSLLWNFNISFIINFCITLIDHVLNEIMSTCILLCSFICLYQLLLQLIDFSHERLSFSLFKFFLHFTIINFLFSSSSFWTNFEHISSNAFRSIIIKYLIIYWSMNLYSWRIYNKIWKYIIFDNLQWYSSWSLESCSNSWINIDH